MDKRQFHISQRVKSSEIRDAFDLVESEIRAIRSDAFAPAVRGFLMAAVNVDPDAPPNQTVDVGPLVGWDKDGKQVTKTSTDNVAIANLAGDPLISRLYVKFLRVQTGSRPDPLGGPNILYDQNDGFVLETDDGAPNPSPTPVALRTDESIHLADITVPASGGAINTADIDTSVQEFNSDFPLSRLRDLIAVLEGGRDEIKVVRVVSPTTQMEIEFCRVSDSLGKKILAPANNTLVDATLIGVANGLDTGVIANNTFYFLYAIGDSTGKNADAGLISLGPGAPFGADPTLPSGYDLFRRIASMRTATTGGARFMAMRKIDNVTLYEDVFKEPDLNIISADPGVTIDTISATTAIPITAERGFFALDVESSAVGHLIAEISSGAAATSFFGGDAITARITGGTAAGVGRMSANWIPAEVDGSQAVRWSNQGAAWDVLSKLYVRGYAEDLKHSA